MATVTVEIEDDEILVALKRGEDYEDVHPQLIAEEAIGDRWPEYRTIEFDASGDSDMDELTQPQKFVIWYERIRDREFAARYFDLANRISDDRRVVVGMLDWVEENVERIWMPTDGIIEIEWIGQNGTKTTRGKDLRESVRKAMESEQ